MSFEFNLAVFISGILAFIGVRISQRKVTFDTIHQATDWRQNLYNVSKKHFITYSDVELLRTSVRPSSNSNKNDLDNLIIKNTKKWLKDYYCDNSKYWEKSDKIKRLVLKREDEAEFRNLCRFLLKSNWLEWSNKFSLRVLKDYEHLDLFFKVKNDTCSSDYKKLKKMKSIKFIKFIMDNWLYLFIFLFPVWYIFNKNAILYHLLNKITQFSTLNKWLFVNHHLRYLFIYLLISSWVTIIFYSKIRLRKIKKGK